MRASLPLLTVTALLALAAAPSIAQNPMNKSTSAKMSGGSGLVVALAAENGSGESGTATLKQVGKNLQVVLAMKNPTNSTQPAHIHKGTCANLNPKPQYPLKSVKNGTSRTTLKNVSLAQLMHGQYAVNVHDSPKDIKKYVACGNITGER